MAIYHLTVKAGSKNKGQSAKAKSDYISRTGKYARDSEEVAFTASGNMPGWAKEPGDFWRATDTYERANGVVFREVEFSLPRELSHEQQCELAQGFADLLTRDLGLPYSLAIHRGGGHNPHCHLMLSESVPDEFERGPETFFKRYNKKAPERGGCKKADIASKRKPWLEHCRKSWADIANFALEKAGFDERIDHRSLIDQGITDRLPQIHLGAGALAQEAKGIRTDRVSEALEIQGVNDEFKRIAAVERDQASRIPEPTPEPAKAPERKPKPKPAAKKKPVNEQGLFSKLRDAVRAAAGRDTTTVQHYDFFEQRRKLAEQDALRSEKLRAELEQRERERERNREQIQREIERRKEKALLKSRPTPSPGTQRGRDRGCNV